MFLFTFIVFLDCRCCLPRYNNDIKTNFLLLQHFWPCLNNVIKKKTPCDHKKHRHSPTILKTDRRTPAPPRGDIALW